MDKKKLFIGITVLLLVSCNSELDYCWDENDYILITTPAITVETDSRSVTKNELTEGDSFGILGYCVPYQVGTSNPQYNAGSSFWSIKYGQCPPDVFYNEKVTVQDGYCTYDNIKYWYREDYDVNGNYNQAITGTDNYRYSFFGYYPYSDQTSVDKCFSIDEPSTNITNGAPKFTFSMPQNGVSVSDPLTHENTPDAMFGVLYNRTKSQGSLSFNFSHMLTALGFEVNNFSDFNLEINKVTLSGKFFKKIVLDFSQTGTLSYSFPDEYYIGTYTLYDKDENKGQPLVLPPPSDGNDCTTSGLLPKNIDGNGEHIMLISGKEPYFGPEIGNVTDNPKVVHVSIDYNFGGTSGTFSSARPTTFVPQPGTKYTAQLNFVGDAFILQFILSNNEQWEDGGSDNDPSSEDDEDGNGDIIFQ